MSAASKEVIALFWPPTFDGVIVYAPESNPLSEYSPFAPVAVVIEIVVPAAWTRAFEIKRTAGASLALPYVIVPLITGSGVGVDDGVGDGTNPLATNSDVLPSASVAAAVSESPS
jgi:hypothetical protein